MSIKDFIISLISAVGGGEDIRNLSPDEFELRLNEKECIILDVRTEEEFSSGFIKGAKNINFLSSDFRQQISRLDKNKKYLVYCASGGRSAAACKIMSDLGFVECYNLKGGINAWKKAGKPVKK
ncbi:MAG: rhodanese-like domain-containing protein [Verrucomicrobiae bacterium]|nr:rhodanese-like domain-containing protein [Verrucomicrobiae bacterium]